MDVEDGSVIVRNIKDPIHDYIPVSRRMASFIDTEQFQRLRNIKQLGTTSFVWPTGNHTRFEHSLGVARLARLMAEHLKQSQPSLNITDRDVYCVELAGLCHDLGHGPWSHVWDGMFIPQTLPNVQWTHEEGSEMMVKALVKENDEVSITEEDLSFILALIAGDPKKCSPKEKPFLFDIVANKRNGLDVDKLDYILRDTHSVGSPLSLSLLRLINGARVLEDQICYDVKDANHIYQVFQTRFTLHKIFYNHKSARAIEYMIIDALVAAEKHMKIAERIKDPKKFLHLTDTILLQIEQSVDEPALELSRSIIKRIRKRQLYTCVDHKSIPWPMRQVFRQNVTPERIVEAAMKAQEASTDEDTINIKVEDVIVDFSTMHYGMKEKNPLDSVGFYSKLHPDRCQKVQPGDCSTIMPPFFAEDLLRIFSKSKEKSYIRAIQQGYRAILLQMSKEEELGAFATTIETYVEEDGVEEDIPTIVHAGGLDTPHQSPPVALGPSTPTEPTPSTPKPKTRSLARAQSRSWSMGVHGSGGTPFSENNFTTMPLPPVPGSPTRQAKRKRLDTADDDPSGGLLMAGTENMRSTKKTRS